MDSGAADGCCRRLRLSFCSLCQASGLRRRSCSAIGRRRCRRPRCPIPALPSVWRRPRARHPDRRRCRRAAADRSPAAGLSAGSSRAEPAACRSGRPCPGGAVADRRATARTCRNINGGLVWRIFADRPDETGTFKMLREDRGADAEHRAAARQLRRPCLARTGQRGARSEPQARNRSRRLFCSAAGGLAHRRAASAPARSRRTRSRSPSTRAASSMAASARRCVPSVAAGDVRAAAGGHLLHRLELWRRQFGGAFRYPRPGRQAHRRDRHPPRRGHHLEAVSDKGGEALANTAWSVINPGGDVIKELIGAFPRVVLVGRRVSRDRQERRQGLRAHVQCRERRRRRGRGGRARRSFQRQTFKSHPLFCSSFMAIGLSGAAAKLTIPCPSCASRLPSLGHSEARQSARPHARLRHLAARPARVMRQHDPHENREGAGKAGSSPPPWPPATKKAGGSHHRFGRDIPALPARWFTAYT